MRHHLLAATTWLLVAAGTAESAMFSATVDSSITIAEVRGGDGEPLSAVPPELTIEGSTRVVEEFVVVTGIAWGATSVALEPAPPVPVSLGIGDGIQQFASAVGVTRSPGDGAVSAGALTDGVLFIENTGSAATFEVDVLVEHTLATSEVIDAPTEVAIADAFFAVTFFDLGAFEQFGSAPDSVPVAASSGMGPAPESYLLTFTLAPGDVVTGFSVADAFGFAAVPEPGGLALAGLGLGALGLVGICSRFGRRPS